MRLIAKLYPVLASRCSRLVRCTADWGASVRRDRLVHVEATDPGVPGPCPPRFGAVAYYFLATFAPSPVDPAWGVEGDATISPGLSQFASRGPRPCSSMMAIPPGWSTVGSRASRRRLSCGARSRPTYRRSSGGSNGTRPIEGPFTGEVHAASFLSSGSDEMRSFLERKQGEQPGLRFRTLPRYEEVVLF